MKPFTEETALTWATRRCSLRECCPQEIVRKFREGGLPESRIAHLVARLVEEGYLDEGRYAKAFVHDKVAYDHWGRMKIRAALRLKGIPDAEINRAFAETDGADYRLMMKEVLTSKFRTLQFDPGNEAETYKATQKLLRFAASRGFEADEVFSIIHELKAV